MKLGRLPQFLYDDAAIWKTQTSHSVQNRKSLNVSHSVQMFPHSVQMNATGIADAEQYKSNFSSVFQYLQERCQHHIHKLVDGKRMVPNACRSKTNRQECKHGAPWTNRVSPSWMSQPLLVCKGIAKLFNLRTSGVRNWLGQTLGYRNDEWFNGTMPGLCVALGGSNSDVKPHDRLPITADTHESICHKRCVVKKHNLKRTTRIT